MNLDKAWKICAFACGLGLVAGCGSTPANTSPDLAKADFSQGGQDLSSPQPDLTGSSSDLTGSSTDLAGADLSLVDMTATADMASTADLTVPNDLTPVDTATVLNNAMCGMAVPVVNGTSLTAQDATTGVDDLSSDCNGGGQGGVLYYSATVPAGSYLTVTATPGSSWDPVIRVLDSCTATSCLTSADQHASGGAETATLMNTGGAPQNVIIAVGSYNAGTTGLFSLAVVIGTIPPPPANVVCASATPVVDGTMLNGENTISGVDDLSNSCDFGATGGVLYYSTSIPAGSRLSVTATPTGAPWSPVVRMLDACGATSCLGGYVDPSTDGLPTTLVYNNIGGAPQKVIIAVGSSDSALFGTFNLAVAITALPPPPPNRVCTTPTQLTAGVVVNGEDTLFATDDLSGVCDTFSNGTVLYYSIDVPAGNRLTATATPTTSWSPVVRVLDSCGAASCLVFNDPFDDGQPTVVSYNNRTASSQKLIIAVGSSDSSITGTFNILAELATLPPPPPNAVCANALTLTPGTPLTAQDASNGIDNLTADCLASADGAVLYYNLAIPAGTNVQIKAMQAATWDSTIRLLASCGAASCLASADSGGTGTAEVLSYSNFGGAPLNTIVAVGSYDAATTGTFDISVTSTTLPANRVCSAAVSVADGTILSAQPAIGVDDLTASCVSGGHGGAVYYTAMIPAGKTFKAVAVPDSTWDPVLRLLNACGAASCLASADVGAGGGTETLTYKNAGAGPITVFLAVGSYNASVTGTFGLTVTIN